MGRKWPGFIAIILLVIGISWRYKSIFTEIWLPEAVVISTVKTLNSPFELFSVFRSTDNYLGSSLYCYLISEPYFDYAYRYLSLTAGTLLLLVFPRLFGESTYAARAVALSVLSLSYPLVIFSADIQGVMLLLLIAALSHALFRIYYNTQKTWPLILFWLTTVAGILTHPSFLLYYLSLMAYSLILTLQPHVERNWFIDLHIVPVIFLFSYYLYFLHYLTPGITGELYSQVGITEFSASFLGLTGIVEHGQTLSGIMLMLLALLVLEILVGIFNGVAEYIFYLLVSVVVPAIFIWLDAPVNWLFIPILFLVIVFGRLLARLFSFGIAGASIYAVVLIVLFWGNWQMFRQLKSYGRGSPKEMLQIISDLTEGDVATVRYIGPVTVKPLFKHYWPRLKGVKDYLLSPVSDLADNPTEWLIEGGFRNVIESAREIIIGRDSYRQVRIFPAAYLSGITYVLYHRVGSNRPGN
ncbi:MAG: hypothetical protein D6719_06255 [Candidatus Dadabacteria bacterium]|nr:MAG: hypothetical protein D6719_06255 [Candidatus Dadabacteria bacterium]